MVQKLAAFAVSCCMVVTGFSTFAEEPSNDAVLTELEQSYIVSVLMEDDFDDYTDESKLNARWKMSTTKAASPAKLKDDPKDISLGLAVGPDYGVSELVCEFSTPLSGVVAIRASYQYSETDVHRKLMMSSLDSNYKNENYFLWANKNSQIERQPGNVFLQRYETDTWYDIMTVIDMPNHRYDLYINGQPMVRGADTPNQAFQTIKKLYFIKQWDDKAGTHTTYFDDIKVYQLTPLPAADFAAATEGDQVVMDAAAIPHQADSIALRFTTPMDAESLKDGIRLTKDNAPVEAVGALEDDKTTYTLALKEVLVPDAAYQIHFSEGITSDAGIGLITKQLELKTAANVLYNLRAECEGKPLTGVTEAKGKTVTILGNTTPEAAGKDVLLFAALYRDNRLAAIQSLRTAAPASNDLSMDMDIPNDDGAYTIRIFAWDGTQQMTSYTDCVTILP